MSNEGRFYLTFLSRLYFTIQTECVETKGRPDLGLLDTVASVTDADKESPQPKSQSPH